MFRANPDLISCEDLAMALCKAVADGPVDQVLAGPLFLNEVTIRTVTYALTAASYSYGILT